MFLLKFGLQHLGGVLSPGSLLLSSLLDLADVFAELLPLLLPGGIPLLLGLSEGLLQLFLVFLGLPLLPFLGFPGIQPPFLGLRRNLVGLRNLPLFFGFLELLINVLDGKLRALSCFLGGQLKTLLDLWVAR